MKRMIKWILIFQFINIFTAAIVGQIQTEYLIRKINHNTNKQNQNS
jgi:hypothetical protein